MIAIFGLVSAIFGYSLAINGQTVETGIYLLALIILGVSLQCAYSSRSYLLRCREFIDEIEDHT